MNRLYLTRDILSVDSKYEGMWNLDSDWKQLLNISVFSNLQCNKRNKQKNQKTAKNIFVI